jgi:GxxExxY protein
MSRASESYSRVLTLDYPYDDLTGEIIGAAFAVHNAEGFGFLEKVYRRALVVELAHRGVSCQQEVSFPLFYRGVPIGIYRADLIVESRVIVEVKTGFVLDPAVVPQTLNYLKASDLSVGLVLYFGPSVKVKRVTSFPMPPQHQGSGESDDHR